MIRLLVLLLPVLLAVSPAHGDDQFRLRPPGAPSTLEASADAVVRVPPDLATLTLGVVSEAANAKDAADENARRANEVVNALARVGVTGKDVRTQALALSPVYDNRPSDAPRIRAYRATNQIVVTTTNLALVGRILDEATRAGANMAGELRLGLTDPGTAQTAAYREATREALARATAMAEAIGKRITRVVEIRTIETGSPRPMMGEMTMMRTTSAASPTPVEPGELTVQARVLVRAEFQ
jgi:uncharacterized protein YggE